MATLRDVTRVHGDGTHNAFTDLLHWQGHYYLCFRVSENHGIKPPGEIVVLRSADLQAWEECGRLRTAGDDRDPKLVDMGDRLAVTFGTWYKRWADHSLANEPYDLISHVCFAREGSETASGLRWSAPRQMWSPNYWLWRIFKDGDSYLCPAYHFPKRTGARASRTVHLLRSTDLLDWQFVTVMRQGFDGGEPALFRPAPDTLRCVLRAVEPDNHSWLGESRAPYTDWQWRDLGVMIHAPVVLRVGEQWIVAGRSQPHDLPEGTVPLDSGHHTSVWALDDDGRIEHLLTVPSAGDCSYCGLAPRPGGRGADELLLPARTNAAAAGPAHAG